MEEEIKYVCCVIEKNCSNSYDTVTFPYVDEEEIDNLFNIKNVIKIFKSNKITFAQKLAQRWISEQIEIEKSKLENLIEQLFFPD